MLVQQILVAWDGSSVARDAFDAAIDITRRYDAELVAVSVAYSPAHAETAADRAETVAAAHAYLAQTFSEIADRAHRAGVSVRHEIIEGEQPGKAISEFAHEHGFDMIVYGHHPARHVGRLLLKGALDDLVGGPIPVLVVGGVTH